MRNAFCTDIVSSLLPGDDVRFDLASCTLYVAVDAHRDEVFQALSDGARQSHLTIYRKVRVAIEERAESAELLEAGRVLLPIRPIAPIPIQPIHPVRPVVPVRPQKLATPKLSFAGTQRYKVRSTPFVRYRLRVTNWNAYTAGHFKASPNLPPCGSNKNAARCWVDILDSRTNKRIYGFCALKKPADLTELWFAKKADQAPPAAVRRGSGLEDRATARRYASDPARP